MPLQFNGVTIPENVANALTVNGIDIKDVYFNGVQVWHQSLFAGVWSGSSIQNNSNGIETSGSAYRYKVSTDKYGPWVYLSPSGLGTGESTGATMSTDPNYFYGFRTVAPNILQYRSGYYAYGWCELMSYSPSSGFTGFSHEYNQGFVSAGGALAFFSGSSYGAYITLT